MDEAIFIIEEAHEGGFTARALGPSIFTESDGLDGLHANLRDEGQRPKGHPAPLRT